MNCPHCSSLTATQLSRKTSLGYKVFRCSECGRVFNERTATPFNYLQFPTDVVLLVVLWRLRYKLSLRNLVDSMLSEHRDMEAAKCFFTQAKQVTGSVPERVTTDGHDSYPRAIRRVLGRKVKHRTSRL